MRIQVHPGPHWVKCLTPSPGARYRRHVIRLIAPATATRGPRTPFLLPLQSASTSRISLGAAVVRTLDPLG